MNKKEQNKKLSNDQLWKKAGTNIPITRQDIGIPKNSNNGLQTYTESWTVDTKVKSLGEIKCNIRSNR